ncbi:unnamed protein product [Rotaria sordida]|uniref:Uncharacterized protein n=2 Tax=Rotaria sordida TaxID=392033 RepID=A0A819ZII1_9BILA|nr:unnamed protein product [Rotaria sordida]
MSRKQVLESFLIRICKHLKKRIGPGSIKPNNNWTNLSEAQLIIAGGDINETRETGTRMDFPSLSVNYNCLTKQLTMKIRWSSSSDRFFLASMIINIQSPSTQYYWIINQTKIDQFKLRATLREKERLSEALRLIPANAF